MVKLNRFEWVPAIAGAMLLLSFCMAQQPGGYPGAPSYKNPNPHLGSTGYRGPPLSTALPSTFSRGITQPRTGAGVTRPGPSLPQSFSPSPYVYNREILNRQYQMASPLMSGGAYAYGYLNRTRFGGLPY